MLSRTASNLYWIGRYMERTEFTTRLIEATLRLSSLRGEQRSEQAWRSALSVAGETASFDESSEGRGAFGARRYLTLSEANPNSVRSCLYHARDNARAARNALTRELWEAVNRSYLTIRGRASPGGAQATLNLVEALKAETRGFEGALSRMLQNQAYWFVQLGSVVERGDSTARLLDVKYYLLLPEGEEIGGKLDRDQWTTILQTVSARTAYRLIYRQALKPWLVAELLILNPQLPRSLLASTAKAVELLGEFADSSGRQGEADRLARRRLQQLEATSVDTLFHEGMHDFLRRFIADNAALDRAIAQQFRFG